MTGNAITRTRWRVMVVAALVAPVLSGCLSGLPNGSTEPPEPVGPVLPPLGLGLEIPDELPEPGPFIEDPADLLVLEEFLRVEGKRMLEECDNVASFANLESYLVAELHLWAAKALVTDCAWPEYQTRESIAEAAMGDGNEAEVRDELHAKALEAMEVFAQRMDAHPGPANAVEAQFLVWMVSVYRSLFNAIDFAVEAWQPYEDGSSRDLFQLTNSYLGLIGARADAEVLTTMIDRYPWKSTPCTVDVPALVERVEEKLAHALWLAETHAAPGEDTHWGHKHGNLLMWTLPNVEHAKERGWWWFVLFSEVEAEIHFSYWDNRTNAETWPTIEEAEYLVALHRNQSRWLVAEYNLMQHRWFFNDPEKQAITDWHGNLINGAVHFMASLSLRPYFLEMECPK